jgi:hypothetical protein
MKFTSIVIAALVAATQFSSTFATTPLAIANIDVATTRQGAEIKIDVLANDIYDDDDAGGTGSSDTPNPMMVPVATLPGRALFTFVQPDAAQGVVTSDFSIDRIKPTVLFTPAGGFFGDATFEYLFSVSGASSASVVVTVTVTEVPALTFLPPNAVSTAAAVGTVRGGLIDVASFSAAGQNTASLTALLDPVTDVDNFAALTSFEVVTQSFEIQFANFFNIFRGGN